VESRQEGARVKDRRPRPPPGPTQAARPRWRASRRPSCGGCCWRTRAATWWTWPPTRCCRCWSRTRPTSRRSVRARPPLGRAPPKVQGLGAPWCVHQCTPSLLPGAGRASALPWWRFEVDQRCRTYLASFDRWVRPPLPALMSRLVATWCAALRTRLAAERSSAVTNLVRDRGCCIRMQGKQGKGTLGRAARACSPGRPAGRAAWGRRRAAAGGAGGPGAPRRADGRAGRADGGQWRHRLCRPRQPPPLPRQPGPLRGRRAVHRAHAVSAAPPRRSGAESKRELLCRRVMGCVRSEHCPAGTCHPSGALVGHALQETHVRLARS